jgi:acylphosphatase
MLMRAYMDEVSYCDDGREVVFIKKRDSEKTPEPDDASPSPQRRTLYFSGRVQGVGFRYAAQQIAEGLPVTGYVRNLPDGRVELVVEGAFGDLERLQAEVERAMRGCIHQVDACGSPATGEFKGFSISR